MQSKFHYTNERNVQIVISLLKAHGIRRVIASPGTTNMTFVVSIQNDPWFQVWSSVDERSAAYLACGMASESCDPVVISCTGATASRNYMPGLTEAYYRKLPVIAITSTRGNHKLGHLIDQQVDRRNIPNDIAIESVCIPMVKDEEDEHFCMLEANKAILATFLNGGGPVHINLCTQYSNDFSIEELPMVNVIHRHFAFEELPPIPKEGRVAVYVGAHANFTARLEKAIDSFCSTYNAVVFCDHTSGYRGKYEVHYQLVACQKQWKTDLSEVNLCIHIGEVSGDQFHIVPQHVWRVSPDGALRDTWGMLRRVFMMPEELFFEHYSQTDSSNTGYLDELNGLLDDLQKKIPDLPFGNLWIAQKMHEKLPYNSELHLGIYNSLRSWNFFKLPEGVLAKCNVGGFGIDGGVSSMIGASLVNTQKIYIGVFGDLAFFYDLNVVGNRHVGNNVRILLINNGRGAEFRNYNHPCYFLGDDADDYVAAAGHFGNCSISLVKNFAENLGYTYFSAKNKVEFESVVDVFLNSNIEEKPILFEVFTESKDESLALESILNMIVDTKMMLKNRIKQVAKYVLCDGFGKKILKK